MAAVVTSSSKPSPGPGVQIPAIAAKKVNTDCPSHRSPLSLCPPRLQVQLQLQLDPAWACSC